MKPPSLRPADWARWPLWLGICLPFCALAQTPAPVPSVPAASTGSAAGEAAVDALAPSSVSPRPRAGAPAQPRFDLELDAGEDLREFLMRHLELMRFRTLRDLDASELSRLLAKAPENLRDLLGALGHFSPKIEIDEPVATGPTPLGTVRIRVEPGPVTRVASVNLYFRGDIADSPQAAAQREAITRGWTLVTGQSFTQADWDSAKTAALRTLTAQRYPAGRIYNSLADVDPTDHSVRLSVELDSGAPLHMGEVRVEGAERYDPVTVERLLRLSGVTPGSDYNLAQLQDAQKRIAESGYYDSVFVFVDPTGGQTTSPVVVQLRESKRQKLVLGVGGSTDSGARLSVEHTHHRVPVTGWRATSKLQLERTDQLLVSEWSAPVDEKGWRWISSGQLARQFDNFVTTTSTRLRAGQAQDSTEMDRSFFLQYDRAETVNSALKLLVPGGADASLSANYAWIRRRFDSMPFPEAGHGLGVELGGGTTLGSVREPFVRTQVRWLSYWPLGGRPSRAETGTADTRTVPLGVARPTGADIRPAGRLALRLQGGAVWAREDAPIPDTQLFLTGGDTSVRGYGLRDIGVRQPDGSVSPGRYLAVGSLEWQRPIWRDGVRSPWESVVFVDAGAVADRPSDLRANWGVGAGVRYNSPVGPLQLDLAYGVQPKALRLHFSVGFTF